MGGNGSVLVIGGTGGIGREVARHYHERGEDVIITGRDLERAKQVASELGSGVGTLAFDLAEPDTIGEALSGVGAVSRLVLSSIARDNNPIRNYTIADAVYLATMKLVGYTTAVHTLIDRLDDDSSVVLFGGRAKDRPYPGSTTVTTVNGGVNSLIRTLAVELAPVRFNAIHPGSSATVRSGRASRSTRCSNGRPPAASSRWPTSSTPPSSCWRTAGSTASTSPSTAAGCCSELTGTPAAMGRSGRWFSISGVLLHPWVLNRVWPW